MRRLTNGKTYISLMISLLLCQHVSVNMCRLRDSSIHKNLYLISSSLLLPPQIDYPFCWTHLPLRNQTDRTYLHDNFEFRLSISNVLMKVYAWITSYNLHILTETCWYNNKDIHQSNVSFSVCQFSHHSDGIISILLSLHR